MTLELSSTTRSESLSLLAPECPGPGGQFWLRIAVHLHGVSARFESSVHRDELVRFTLALKGLDATGNGVAVLHGVAPSALELRVASPVRSGHVLVDFKVTRPPGAGHGGRPVQLAGGFEVDPALLPGLVERLERLTRATGGRREPPAGSPQAIPA